MIDLGIILLAALAAVFMLMRGDPHWTHPVIAAVAVMIVVPLATALVFHFFQLQTPAVFQYVQGEYLPHPWPSASLQETLERNYEAIHKTLEFIKAAHTASGLAAIGAAYTHTALSILISVVPGGQLVAVVKWMLGVQRLDPLLNYAFTIYNAATALFMIFHFIEIMAEAAVHMAVPLLMLSLVAMVFGPTRALGGVMYFFALVMILLSHIGYQLAPVANSTAHWLLESAKWEEAAASNATGTAPTPLLATEGAPHTLYLARYNNTFVLPNAAEAAAEMSRIMNFTVPPEAVETAFSYAARHGFYEKAAFNGTDWVAATTNSVTPIAYGEKNWTAYAVNTWLDFPAPTPTNGSCIEHEGFYEFLDLAPDDMRQRIINMTGEICRLHEKLGYRSYHVRVETPAHWRFLTVAINYTAVDKWRVLERGVVYAHNGVWGWLQPPDEERCFDALGREAGCGLLDTTIRRGQYNFSIWSGEKKAVDPVVGEVRSEFNVTLEKAPDPVFSWSEPLHRWVETCEWCCGWTCDESGCWCTRWCSSSRDVFERERVRKILGSGQYQYAAAVYNRPWVPEDPANYTGRVPLVTRRWEVEKWIEYGPWAGDGVPPPGAYCYEHSRRVYKVLQFFQTQPAAPRVVYGFYWLRAGEMRYAPHGDSLPDVIGQYTDADGVEVVEYLEGVEHQYYCSHEFPQPQRPAGELCRGRSATSRGLRERNISTWWCIGISPRLISRVLTWPG
jgi:hypothetical protein